MDETTALLTLWLKNIPENNIEQEIFKKAINSKSGEVSISKEEVIDFMKRFY